MTRDELCGHVADVLALPLSDNQTIQTLQSRVNGADLEQLLVAALSVAREQTRQITGLEYALHESEQWCQQLEDEAQEARELQKRLVREREQLARKTREVQEQLKRLARPTTLFDSALVPQFAD